MLKSRLASFSCASRNTAATPNTCLISCDEEGNYEIALELKAVHDRSARGVKLQKSSSTFSAVNKSSHLAISITIGLEMENASDLSSGRVPSRNLMIFPFLTQ